ncbi:MAG: hypothetical protein ACFB12_02000 [Leptolyngbyaceae cyanobacterium]
MIGTALAIASFLQPTPPPENVVSMLDKSTLIAIVKGKRNLFSGPEHRIRKFNMGNNRIDPELIADGAKFEISFPVVEKEIPLPNDGACEYHFEYPQISGLANVSIQDQINQMLRDELIGDEAAPKLFAYQEECTQGRLRDMPDGERTVTWFAFDVRMNCDLEFASGSIGSVYCRHSVMPGAYPVMTYYPITFDLKTGKKLSFNELFAPDSNFAEAIAKGRLRLWVETSESGTWIPPEGYIQERLELLTEQYENDFDDFYLQSDCQIFNANYKAEKTREFCLSFPRIRSNHIISPIPYSQSITLEEFEEFFQPDGLLEAAMNSNEMSENNVAE